MFGQVISLTGTWMQGVAQSWLVYRFTGSTVLLGTLGFLTHLPVLVLGPVAGMAADRWPRRRIVILAQSAFLLQAAALATLTLSGRVTVPHVLLLATLLGIINAFDIPARQSLYVHLVGKEDLSNAIAINSMTFNAARVVGPAIGGFVVAALGEGLCFLMNALTFLAVIASLLVMRADEPERQSPPSPWKHLRDGFRYAWHTRTVRVLLMVTAIATVATTPASVLGPVFADRIFGRGSAGLGLLVGAMGFGAVIGTIALAGRTPVHRMPAVILTSTLVSAAALAIYSFSGHFPLSLLTMAVLGFSIFRQLAATNTVIQSTIEDEYRGRTMSLYSMTVVGILPLGNLLSGAAAGWLGIRATVLAGAVLSLGAALLWRQHRQHEGEP